MHNDLGGLVPHADQVIVARIGIAIQSALGRAARTLAVSSIVQNQNRGTRRGYLAQVARAMRQVGCC